MSQQNKTTLQNAINTQLADNTTGEISAADVRDNLINMTDSLLFNNGDSQTLNGSLTVTGDIIGTLQGTVANAANATFADLAQQALTANSVPLAAGQGITVNGLVISSNILTVNGTLPDGNGNIPLSLGTVYTGTSASLASTSTASLADATIWVVSGDATPANNGDTYIYKSGSVGQWLVISPLDEAAADARYARINVPAVQSLTSSFSEEAISSSYAATASLAPNYVLISNTSSMSVLSSSYALTASYVAGGGGGAAFPYTGDAVITGTLNVSNGITGSLSGSVTGSLLGTASYASTAISSSIADTASYVDPFFAFNNYRMEASSYIGGVLYNYDFAVTFTDAFTTSDYGYNYYDYQNTSFTYNPSTHLLSLNGGKLAVGTQLSTTGYGSTALGTLNSSSGYFSFSQGSGNKALGDYSHAEGSFTITSGSYSHAEGQNTIASGSYSHAEGLNNRASGSHSHAEGQGTRAIGNYSHTEGLSTRASGSHSHAEGATTLAQGNSSHAEGQFTTALGNYSHAEGYLTLAQGSYSHTEGWATTASGQYSHAEGLNTLAQGNYSHTAGEGTVAYGNSEFAVGKFNNSPSTAGAFTVGNGTSNSNRNTLFAAYANSVDINSGSLTLNGDLSQGQATIVLTRLLDASYADDTAAAAAGIPVGGLYRNGNFIQIRLV